MSVIAAIATPDAVGGISVIRISGEGSLDVAGKIFSGRKRPCEMEGYTCCYGHAVDGTERVDDVVLTVFRAPHSYTGEDTVEISCHGGRYITKKILRIILKNGASPAQAGEFTKRAFLNGKLSLTQAEAVMDVISSGGERELSIANALKDGAMYRRITGVRDSLLKILGDLSAWADFPEEDVPEVHTDVLDKEIKEIILNLNKLLSTYDSGRVIREGINTVICGKPNVGKSTLMNVLSGFERSIVTDIAGTTRDTVEESVRVGDLVLRLSDTAGIRDTDDMIESMGVDIAYKKIDGADLILAVFDSQSELDDKEKELIEHIKNKCCICIINKIDGEQKIDKEQLYTAFENVVEISAKNNEGTEKIDELLEKLFIGSNLDNEPCVLANERQKDCCERCLENLREAERILQNGEMLDAVTVVLSSALECLAELTGESVSESVVDDVFSRFCVGK